MKKTSHVNIGGTSFTLEESAYEALNVYLKSIDSYFVDHTDKDELIKDIESRIAEHFSKIERTINDDDITHLISMMGTVDQINEDISESDKKANETSHTKKIVKRLYRDTEDAKIAGVCSGLAHYFGIDPIIVRMLFLGSLFIGGSGILLYLALWFLVPEAVTTAQKLNMHGSPVTLSTILGFVEEKVKDVHLPKDKNIFSSLILFLRDIARMIVDGIRGFIVPIIGGIVLIVTSFIGLISTFAVVLILLPLVPIVQAGPIQEILQSLNIHILAVCVYIGIIIPCIYLGRFGVFLVGHRTKINKHVAAASFVLWIVSLAISVLLAINLFATVTEKVLVAGHHKIEIKQEYRDKFRSITEYFDLPVHIRSDDYSHTLPDEPLSPDTVPSIETQRVMH